MTVKELIEELSKFPKENEVKIYDSHFEGTFDVDGVSNITLDDNSKTTVYIDCWIL